MAYEVCAWYGYAMVVSVCDTEILAVCLNRINMNDWSIWLYYDTIDEAAFVGETDRIRALFLDTVVHILFNKLLCLPSS